MDQDSGELPRTSDSISNSLDDIPAAGGGVVSEKVQYFANAIYGQLEKLVKKYDEDAVKDLMPHVISLLENLDQLSNEKRQLEVDIELIKEDNSQLLVQYEREKTMRRSIEQKCLEIEDLAEEDKRGLNEKIVSMESIVRILELKSKNSADHVARLEEKEGEMKKDHAKLYQKYQELMRSHIDIMERRAYNEHSTEGAHSSAFDQTMLHRPSDDGDSAMTKTDDGQQDKTGSRLDQFDQAADSVSKSDAATARFEEELSFQEEDLLNTPGRQRARKGDTEQESSDDDADIEGETEDTLGSTPLAGISLGASDAPGRQTTFSVGREFDKLLKENAELLETKNALNVVKDDLIFQVDGLNNELRIFRERIASLEEIREHLQQRVAQLEEDGKRVKEELEETKNRLSATVGSGTGEDEASNGNGQDGAGAEGTQRRRFTRMEMARVLMERNIYKERLIELQETVRWVESLRASREHPDLPAKKSPSIWNIFGGLFSSSPKQQRYHMSSAMPPPPPMPASLMDVNLGAGRVTSAAGPLDISERPRRSFISSQPNGGQGRVEAYGWSIPVSTCFTPSQSAGMARSRAAIRAAGVATPGVVVTAKPEVPIAIPVCCQPLPGSLNGMKIWSAAVAFSPTAIHPDGSRLFERSVFYQSPRGSTSLAGNRTSVGSAGGNETPTPQDGVMPVSADVAELEEEVSLEQHRVRASRGQLAELSSVAWLTCSSNNVNTHVFLVDLRQPSVLLAGFTLDAPYVSQVCAVPGAKPTDIAWQPVVVSDTPQISSRRNSKGETADVQDDCVERSRDGEKVMNTSGWTLTVTEQTNLKNLAPRANANELPTVQQPLQTEGLSEEGALIDNTKSLLMPTMWFGAQDGSLFIYSAASAVQPAISDLPQQLPAMLGRIKLGSAPTAIGHVAGRVFVALASSELAMFHRNPETKEWCLDECSIIEFKRDLTTAVTPTPTPSSTSDSNMVIDPSKITSNSDDPLAINRTSSPAAANSTSVPAARCLVTVANRYLWVGIGREVLVIEPASLRIESSFICHPRQDAQLRHACSVGDGVWLAVRIDSVLRLYHAFTHQHLQDLDLQPAIHSFMFGDTPPTPGSSGGALSPLRVSAMVAGGGRLWIGTHTGLIVSVPFASAEQQISVKVATPVSKQPSTGGATTTATGPATPAAPAGPGTIVQVFASPRSHTLTPGTNMVPYCWVGGAQISCHGHTDSVKSIVCSPVQNAGSPHQNESSPLFPENTSTSVNGGSKPNGIPSLAIMSVGEGYRDCRSQSAIQAALSAGEGVVSGVGLSAILPGSSPNAQIISTTPVSPMMRQNITISPSPPGEERIHMIVWQLTLSGQ